MSVKITVEKVVVRGDQKMLIKKIEGVLAEKDLPREYVNGMPAFWKSVDSTGWDCIASNSLYCELKKGSQITQENLERIRKAGQRLSEINRKLKEQNKNWHGETVFVI